MVSKDWRMSGHAVMDDIPLDIQESITITIITPTPRLKEPSRAARVPTTIIWNLTLRTMPDLPRLLGRSAHGLAVRNRMKAEGQVGSSLGVEATTANFDSVRGALQKHLFPLTIKLPPTTITAIYQTLSLFSHCFWIDFCRCFIPLSFLFFFFSLSVVPPACFLGVLVALAIVLHNQVLAGSNCPYLRSFSFFLFFFSLFLQYPLYAIILCHYHKQYHSFANLHTSFGLLSIHHLELAQRYRELSLRWKRALRSHI